MVTKIATKFIVTERALVGRVNRKLAHREQFITVARQDSRLHHNVGRFSVWAALTGGLVESHVQLDALARELGVIHADEVLGGAP
jgi:hypothetical protein